MSKSDNIQNKRKGSNFYFLKDISPDIDLYHLAIEAERDYPDRHKSIALNMRLFGEALIKYLEQRYNLPLTKAVALMSIYAMWNV